MKKSIFKYYLFIIFLLFIIGSYPSILSGNSPEEKPIIRISTSKDTTMLFHINNFNKEGSFYLTSDYVYESDFISNIFLHSRAGGEEIIQYGNYIFAWGNYRGHILMVFEITNSNKVKLCFTYDDNGIGKYLKIKNDKLILLNVSNILDEKADENIIVFDIKNPFAPEIIAKINKNTLSDNNEFDIRDIYLDEKSLYLLTSKGFMCFDFEISKNPKLISKIDLNKKVYYFAGFKNQRLLLTNHNLEARLNKQTNKNINILSIDVSNPVKPVINDVSHFIEDNSIYKNYNLILEKSKNEKNIAPIYYSFQKDLLFIALNMSIFDGKEEKENLLVFNFNDYDKPVYIDMFKLNYDCQFIFYMDKYFFNFSGKLKSEVFLIDENYSIKKLNKKDIFKLDLSKFKVFKKNFYERAADYGYKKVKEGINSYDFFDPDKVEVKNFFSFSGNIEYIEIKNNIAYIADREQGLIAVDISDLKFPKILGEFKTNTDALRFFIDKNLLFLIDEKYGIRLLNIEDIRNIVRIDDIKISEKLENPTISGVFVYLPEIEITDVIVNANRQKIMILSKKGLNIYNYKSPEYIEFLNNIQINNQLGSIKYFNNKFYIPAFSNMVLELYEYNLKDNNPLLKNYFLKTFSEKFSSSRSCNDFIIDTNNHRGFIMTEKSIDIVKFVPTPKITENIITNELSAEKILSVKYENKKIYALQSKHFNDNTVKNYLRVFEENEGHFSEIICKQIPGFFFDAFAIKDNTFFIENDKGFSINREPVTNIYPLYETTLDKNSETPDKDMVVFDHYLISIINGLKIYDIDDNFKLVSSNKDLTGTKIFVKDSFIYIVDKNGFTIASIKDILNIEILSKYNYKPRLTREKGYPISIFADDKFAYLTIGEKTSNREKKNNYYFHIIDISDPKNPILCGGSKTRGNLVDIQIKNDIAYIVEKGHVSGLEIIDVSDKQYPLRIGEYGKDEKGSPKEGSKIILKNDFAFIAFSKVIHILDIKDSLNPKLIKEIEVKQNFNDFDIKGDYLYIYSTETGLTIMNIKDIEVPFIIDIFPSFYYADRIKVSDKYIFMFDSGKGILVFKNPIKVQFFDSLEPDTIQIKFPGGLTKGKYKLKYFSDKGRETVFNKIVVE